MSIQTLHDIGSSHSFCIDPYELSLKAAQLITLNYTPRKGLSEKNNLFIKHTCQERLWMGLCSIAVNLRMLDEEHKRINKHQGFKRLRLYGFDCGTILITKHQQIPPQVLRNNDLFSKDVSSDEGLKRLSDLTKDFIKNKKERKKLDLRVACNKIIHSTGFKISKNKIIIEGEEEKIVKNKYFYEESVAEIDIIQFVDNSIDFLRPDMNVYKEKARELYSKE